MLLGLLIVDRSFQLNTSDGHAIDTFHDGHHLVQSLDKPTEVPPNCRLLSRRRNTIWGTMIIIGLKNIVILYCVKHWWKDKQETNVWKNAQQSQWHVQSSSALSSLGREGPSSLVFGLQLMKEGCNWECLLSELSWVGTQKMFKWARLYNCQVTA